MKDTILMGKSGCGKTTLIQALIGQELRYAKTQTITRHLQFIDTPGEYIERRHLYRALIVTAADAELVGLVQEAGRETSWIPPSFASTFAKRVFGIVTKVDLAADRADVDHAREALEAAGADPVFEVSSVDGTGLAALWGFLSDGQAGGSPDSGPT